MTTCRFCNAEIATENGKCPRCDEVKTDLPRAQEMANRNRQTGRIVFALMITFAGLTLGYALWTTQFRRANDRPKEQGVDETAGEVAANWSALKLAQKDSDALMGFHVKKLLESEAGKKILASFPQAGPLAGSLGQIDHAIVSVSLSKFPPRIMLVGRTARPLTIVQLLGDKTTAHKIRRQGRDLWLQTVHFNKVSLEVAVFLDGDSFAISLADDFDNWQPANTANIRTALSTLIKTRVEEGSPVWIAGIPPEPNPIPGLMNLFPDADRAKWSWMTRLKQIAVSDAIEGDAVRIRCSLQFNSDADLAVLKTQIEAMLGSLVTAPVELTSEGDWIHVVGRWKPAN